MILGMSAGRSGGKRAESLGRGRNGSGKWSDWASYRIIYGVFWLLSLLPTGVLYGLAHVLYLLVYYVIGYRKSIVIQNLARAFPDKKYEEIQLICRRFYLSFGQWMAEIVKLVSVSPRKLSYQVELVGFDFVYKCLRESRNVIAGMGHFGNWEMMSILPDLLNGRVASVYKPLQNKVMDRFLYRVRTRFGMEMIASSQVVRHMLSGRENASLYLFIADQCPPCSTGADPVVFLNQPTSMLPGIEKLSLATNSAVVYFYIKKKTRGHYLVECIPICEDPRQAAEISITTSYKDLLELNIEASPENWLWTHKRWKR